MAQGSGLRPWMRGTSARRLANQNVIDSGDLIVTDDGDVFAGDGVTQARNLKRLVRLNETADQVIPGHAYFNGSRGVRGSFLGVGAGVGSARMPVFKNILVHGPWISNTLATDGADDYVAEQLTVTFNGGFNHLKRSATGGMTAGSGTVTLSTGTINPDVQVGWYVFVPGAGAAIFKGRITSIASDRASCVISTAATATVSGVAITFAVAADPNFVFGNNRIYLSGNNSGDLSGIDYFFGGLEEAYMNTPGATLKSARSLALAGGPGGADATIDEWTQLHIKTVENRGANTTIGRAIGLFIDSKPTDRATDQYAIYVDGGGKSLLRGTLRVAAQNAADDVLAVQTPLNPTGKAVAVWDVTGTQRVFSINPNGSIQSSSFFTAFEGNPGGQVGLGQQPGGFPGASFGMGANQMFLKLVTGTVLGVDSTTKAIGTGAGTTSQRPATPVAGAIFVDTTLGKPVFYISGEWKDATGAAV